MPKLSKPPQFVIFDCDGVLVDSEPTSNRVLHEFLCSCGADLSLSNCSDTFTGKSKYDVDKYISDEGLDAPENWSEQFYDQALEALRNEVTAIHGVQNVLRKLMGSEIKFCVASNGLMAKMHVTLERTQILPLFEGNMFSAYEVGLSKPAPDVFLHAAEVNGFRPQDCVVVEDSASGFEAAASANMTCFAYVPIHSKRHDNLFGAIEFKDMKELPSMLGLS